jgi:oxygen-independent coproporphyrinogen-3 oxidase
MNSEPVQPESRVESQATVQTPPLSLYVHMPWCVRKCPYCDFNSHQAPAKLPRRAYIDALIADLEFDLPLFWGRSVGSIFLGGGTPSLALRQRLRVAPDAEITLEANPGTLEHDTFAAYRDAGVNRVSLGVQSFNDALLKGIGRIHGQSEAERAVESIHASGITNFNIDLMYALPGQSRKQAVADVETAVDCGPAHISHYQLTIEPNTAFHARPPELPDEDAAWDMQEECSEVLASSGFGQYEISAWSRPGQACRHNLNYWRYGDYLGIGAGAHSKLTLAADSSVRRRVRLRHPAQWMKAVAGGAPLAEDRALAPAERTFEFFLNQLRLRDGVRKAELASRAGVPWAEVRGRVESAVARGLLRDEDGLLRPTDLGWRFVNELQAIFLP